MKGPSAGSLSFTAVALAAAVLMAIGPPGHRAPIKIEPSAAPGPSSVSANGFSLVSGSIDLPVDEQLFPEGPGADVVNANCRACHSPAMALTQPALSGAQWGAVVTKMREVYKAPIDERDVPAIVAYLGGISAHVAGNNRGGKRLGK